MDMNAPKTLPKEIARTNNGPLVFVVQNPHRWDHERQKFVPKHDIETANVFGDVVELLSPTASPFNFPTVREELHHKLKHYRDGDFILLVGNPALIGAVTAIAASYNDGRCAVLQWSGKDQRYTPIDMLDLGARDN